MVQLLENSTRLETVMSSQTETMTGADNVSLDILHQHQFALVSPDGVINMTAFWYTTWDGTDNDLCVEVYFRDYPGVTEDIAAVSQTDFGALNRWYEDAVVAKRLISFHEFSARVEGLWRIDDLREFDDYKPNNQSYMVWNGEEGELPADGPRMEPNTVYACYTTDSVKPSRGARLDSVEEVMALWTHPNARIVVDVDDNQSRLLDNEGVEGDLGLANVQVVLWCLHEIEARIRQAHGDESDAT